MTYRHGDDWAVGMVGGSAVRAEIKSVARCVVMIALSIVLVAGLVPLAPGYAPVAQAAEGDETLSSQLAEEAELLAAGVDVDEKQTPELYDTNIEDANCHQLVLVVRFAGDTTGDGDTGLNAVPTGSSITNWQSVYTSLNGQPLSRYASPSLYSYLKEVSGGRCRIQSITPQMSDDGRTVAYLTLPGSRDSYVAHSSVVEAAVNAFNARYPEADFSGLIDNGEGYISNVLVIPETGDVVPEVGTTLWPRQDDYPGELWVGARGKAARVGSYTIVDTTHVLHTGTIVHEAIHAFGAKDLYRAATVQLSNHAVGMWDIMAMNSGSRLMRPLFITLQDCGWAEIEEVEPGTHTLDAPSASGRSAVKFKSPYSDSEYFVAEFRSANTDIGNLSALDTAHDGFTYTIGGTGLIVYRVNPAAKDAGNKGDKDYVYLFRPNETVAGGVRGDGEGDLKHAQLSAAGTSSLGSLDLADSLGEGAITLSNGANSGLMVRVVSNDNTSLTFELPVAKDEGGWKVPEITGAALPASGYYDTKLVSENGKVYQLCSAFRKAPRIFCLEGSTRSDLGAPSDCSESFYAVDLAVCDGVVYLCGSDGVRTVVWRRTGSSWSVVDEATVPATTPILGVAGRGVYLYADNFGSGGSLYRVGADKLSKVGSALAINQVYNPRIIDRAGSPVVVFGSGSETKMAWPEAEAWKASVLHSGTSSSISTTESNGVTYIASSDGEHISISSITADGFDTAEVTEAFPKPYSVAIAARDNMLYLAVVESGTQLVRVYKASASNLSQWEHLGGIVITSATAVGLTVRDASLFCATVDTFDSPVGLRSFALPSEMGGKPDVPSGSGGAGTIVPGDGGSGSSGSSGAGGSSTGSGSGGTGGSSIGSGSGGTGNGSSTGGATGSGSGVGGSGSSSASSKPAAAKPSGVWKKSGGRWWYRHHNGSYTRNGWELIDGSWYHFDRSGWMQTGWLKVGRSWYYLSASGAMKTGWFKQGRTWYYLKSSGAMAVGWFKVGGDWYWSSASGAMGANCWIGNYYLKGSGAMATNQWIGRYHVNASGKWDKTR